MKAFVPSAKQLTLVLRNNSEEITMILEVILEVMIHTLPFTSLHSAVDAAGNVSVGGGTKPWTPHNNSTAEAWRHLLIPACLWSSLTCNHKGATPGSMGLGYASEGLAITHQV